MKLNNFKKISGDASFRSFYRTKKSILVFCKKEKKINLEIYDAINKILNRNKIKAPLLISNNYYKNYIEIEDFGDQTVFRTLKKNKKKQLNIYSKILIIINKLQKIKNVNTSTFLGNKYTIPKYNNKKILDEANLFIKWFLPRAFKKSDNKLSKKLKIILLNLIKKIEIKKKVFVHRDFHISNLIIYQKKIILIDNQDAQMGHVAYDLASLIDDVRFETSIKLKNRLFLRFLKMNKNLNIKKFTSDFEILSVLRNLKIIGIFSRLFLRDNKKKYIKLIPYAWKLIDLRIDNNKEMSELKKFLRENNLIHKKF
ncbi:MAG: phosphotransferase [Candidatus Pelagibacter sp.]|nr:phosphotransferase [Candidatus Pelagibacter sp.]